MNRRNFLKKLISHIAAAGVLFRPSALWALSGARVRNRPGPFLKAFGLQRFNRLGPAVPNNTTRTSLVEVTKDDPKELFVGTDTVFYLRENGTLWSWGNNDFYQAGHLPNTTISRPTQMGNDYWKYVSSYNSSTLGIKSDHSLWAWGRNDMGQLGHSQNNVYISTPIQIGTDSDWASGACATNGVIYLKSDGRLYQWGTNGSFGAPIYSSPSQLTTQSWKMIDAGDNGRIALRSDDSVWVWGNLTHVVNSSTPVQIGAGHSWKHVAVGRYNIFLVRDDNTLWVAGRNSDLSQGRGESSTMNYSSLVQVGTSSDWAKVFSNSYAWEHVFAIRTDGTLWNWGGTFSVPNLLSSETDWATVSVGFNGNSLALKSDGRLYSYGYNQYGQAGLGNLAYASSPSQVGTSTWSSVASFLYCSFGVRSDGTLWGWGQNVGGLFGPGFAFDQAVSTPIQIGSDTTWSSVSGGGSREDTSTAGLLGNLPFVIARKTSGQLFSWGVNTFSALGYIADCTFSSPVQIAASINWKKVLVGKYLGAGISMDNKLYTWGCYCVGALGHGSDVKFCVSPTQVGTSSDWSDISMSIHDTGATPTDRLMALKTTGQRFAIGDGYNRIFGSSTFLKYSVPQALTGTDWKKIEISTKHAYGLKTNQSLWYWGTALDNSSFVTSPVQLGGTWKDFKTTRISHAVIALDSDDQYWAWGHVTGVSSSPVMIGSAQAWSDIFGVGCAESGSTFSLFKTKR